MEVRNTGESNVTLLLDRTDSTWVSIPDGSGFSIENPDNMSGGGRTLPGGDSALLQFVVGTTGSAVPGRHVIAGALLASEDNSDRMLYASKYAGSSADSVAFELVCDPQYVAGSLTPLVASSGASVSFEARIASDALRRSALILEPENVYLSFGDADGDTFRTVLSSVSEHVLSKGEDITLVFETGSVDTAIAHTTLPVALHLGGTENGNPFSADAMLSDSVIIERAPQLSINRVVVPQSVTRSQVKEWPVRLVLKNNGEASVAISLDDAKTFVSFNIIGVGDRTYEYAIEHPDYLEGSRDDTLAGGAVDSLVFTVTATGSTAGLALVNGKVTGVDINNGVTISDDTYSGGFSHMAIQMPGEPAITRTTPSRSAVTSAQTTSWRITLELCNEGEANLSLMTDSTRVFYDNGLPLAYAAPAEFVEGGLALAEGSCKHLVFEVSPSPAIPAGADVALHAHAGFSEDNSSTYVAFDTRQEGSGSGAIRVQAPARLRISQVTNNSVRSPYVNMEQKFSVMFEVKNEGEAQADSIRVALETAGSSTIEDTLLMVGSLDGSSSIVDTFALTAGTSSGPETFKTRLRGALDANSLQSDLVAVEPALDDTALAVIQGRAALEILSMTPSQAEVNANQSADWTVRVSLKNNGEAPLELAVPAAGDISFFLGATALADYLVIPPDTLASGSGDLILAGGASDALVYLISSTGRDTGYVTISADIGWSDMNDAVRETPAASGSGSVHVKSPSGLRIIAVTSEAPNNALYPNTSIVNVGQIFNVAIRVENTGGDDLDSVSVRLVSNGASQATLDGSQYRYLASKSEQDFVYSIAASSMPGIEILSASIIYAVSKNTGERVYPAEAAESVENLRVQLSALLSCGASVTSPAGAVDDTLSTGQTFVLSAIVANEGQAQIDTTGQVTLMLPTEISLANSTDPLVKRFAAGSAVSWTLVAPATSSMDTVKVLISGVPNDVNLAAPAALHVSESIVPLRTIDAAGISGCALSIAAPPGAVDGTLSTDQDLTVRAVFTPSTNADSVWIELDVPAGFSVSGDRAKYIGKGTGARQTIDWLVKAPPAPSTGDTIATRAGGKDVNSGVSMHTCRAVFFVRVQEKPELDLTAGISGPEEALDGVVSVDLPFTVTATIGKSGEASIDTAGARVEIVLPDGQGYALDGSMETYKKPFYPGETIVWNVVAPAAPTSPSNIEVKLVEPYATDVNTNLACAISNDQVFIAVQTEAGSVFMSNISHVDTIPPYVVPQGAQDVPVMRIVLRNNTGYTIGLDTLMVAIENGNGDRVSNPTRSIESIAIIWNGTPFEAAVTTLNPVPIAVGHDIEIMPGSSDTLLLRTDIAAGAPAGEIRCEIERSADVVMSITISGEDLGPRIGVGLEGSGADIAGHFLSGPFSIMSKRFDEYAHNYPNPFRAGSELTKICYFLNRDSNVSIRIFDLGGNLVKSMTIGSGEAGGAGTPGGTWHEISWDGRNERGDIVRNGVYMCKIEAGSQSALIKIAVAK
ncbi:MAG: hypothetical protein PHD74_03540 [Candidatus Krumholzibacteria bacterium]|nr:hypothetical protein [Candidatus Krumholzibacteria bacterium]